MKVGKNLTSMRTVALVVFLFPVVISLFIGTFVMAEVLEKPERELNLWPFKDSGFSFSSSELLIKGLQKEYSTSDTITAQISVTDPSFDCGDLYITIYNSGVVPKQVVTQSGFFDQCFQQNNLLLPIDDKFSEQIDTPGQYEIIAEMNDKTFRKIISANEKFIVK